MAWDFANYYDVGHKVSAGEVENLYNKFALIEGKVLSVNTSGSTYRWTRDFAVVIPRRSQGGFRAAGLELKTLEGRRVRRSGPRIDGSAR